MRRQNRWVEVRSWWAKAHPTSAILCVLALACLACGEEPPRLLQQGDPEATVAAWRESFDEVPASHPSLARANRVFERVRDRAGTYAELIVLDLPYAPLALALADPAVLLSSEGLELCYRGVSPEEGDARLAFLLGHELAHLGNNDFWHVSAFATVENIEDPTEQEERLQTLLALDSQDRKKLELKADEAGILTAIQAGYDVQPLLAGDRTFFGEWVDGLVGSTAYDDPDHPGVAERAEYVRLHLEKVAHQTEHFDRGVTHFREAERLARSEGGREVLDVIEAEYRAAIEAFGAFGRHFDGREVLSNQALAHLRLATAQLAGCDGSLVNRYYLPTALDPVTLATRDVLRGEREYSSHCFEDGDYQRHMRAAIRLLDEAVERDPLYLPARLNLTAAFVLDEMPANAVVQGEAAAEIDADDPRAAAAPWVARVADHDRGGPVAIDEVLQELVKLHRRFPDDPGIAFNLASALSYQGRLDEARPVWRDFLRVEPRGPWARIAEEWVGEEP
jgi:tetratricopeptide (TPR) repeat protein